MNGSPSKAYTPEGEDTEPDTSRSNRNGLASRPLRIDIACIRIFQEPVRKLVSFTKLSRKATSTMSYWEREWHREAHRHLSQWSTWDRMTSLVNWKHMKDTLEKLYRSYHESTSSSPLNHIPSYRPDISETFDTLRVVLLSRPLTEQMKTLSMRNAKAIISLLDQALDREICTSNSDMHRRVMVMLRFLSAQQKALPPSYFLKRNDVKVLNDRPTSGGSVVDIWKGEYDAGGRNIEVALKVLRVYISFTEPLLKKLYEEAVIWKHLRHPNIVPFIGLDSSTRFPMCLVSSWMSHGTINVFLREHPEADRFKMLQGIVEGLRYMHESGVVHGDLKGENILVNDEDLPCLSGFDLVAIRSDPDVVSVRVEHTEVRWSAPELIDPESFGLASADPTYASDIYALSMVMWEIYTGKRPFDDIPIDAWVIFKVVKGIRPSRPSTVSSCGLSDRIWSLMQSCWRMDMHSRPTAESVVEELASARGTRDEDLRLDR